MGLFSVDFILRALGPGFTVSFSSMGRPALCFSFFGENFSFFLDSLFDLVTSNPHSAGISLYVSV